MTFLQKQSPWGLCGTVYHHYNVIVSYSTSYPPSVTQPPQNLSAAIMSNPAMPPTDAALKIGQGVGCEFVAMQEALVLA